MPLYLKDPEADALARELAARQGVSITEAVLGALRDKRRSLEDDYAERKRRMAEAVARFNELPVLDPRHPDEILYDEDGIPK